MRHERLPDSDHVARYCKPSTVDERGQPMASAFAIRAEGDQLWVNWLERSGVHGGTDNGSRDGNGRDAAVGRVRNTLLSKGSRLRAEGRFAVLNVGQVKATISQTLGRSLGITHLPLADDASRAGILGYGDQDLMIAVEIKAALLAEDVQDAL